MIYTKLSETWTILVPNVELIIALSIYLKYKIYYNFNLSLVSRKIYSFLSKKIFFFLPFHRFITGKNIHEARTIKYYKFLELKTCNSPRRAITLKESNARILNIRCTTTNFPVLVGWRICIWELELLSEIFSSLALDIREGRYDGRGLEIYRGSADPCSTNKGSWKKNDLKETQYIFSLYLLLSLSLSLSLSLICLLIIKNYKF